MNRYFICVLFLFSSFLVAMESPRNNCKYSEISLKAKDIMKELFSTAILNGENIDTAKGFTENFNNCKKIFADSEHIQLKRFSEILFSIITKSSNSHDDLICANIFISSMIMDARIKSKRLDEIVTASREYPHNCQLLSLVLMTKLKEGIEEIREGKIQITELYFGSIEAGHSVVLVGQIPVKKPTLELDVINNLPDNEFIMIMSPDKNLVYEGKNKVYNYLSEVNETIRIGEYSKGIPIIENKKRDYENRLRKFLTDYQVAWKKNIMENDRTFTNIKLFLAKEFNTLSRDEKRRLRTHLGTEGEEILDTAEKWLSK